MSKIDRTIGNHHWENKFPNVEVTYYPEEDFDHTPMPVYFLNPVNTKKPFKFYNHWGKEVDFLETFNTVWNEKVDGFLNYQILTKMQLLKKVLRNKYMSTHIEDNLRQVERYFNDIQTQLHFDPHNLLLADQEHLAAGNPRKIKGDYALYTWQRGKLNRLKYGDDNTKLFHYSINQRRNTNTIRTLHIDGNKTTDQCKIQHTFIQYFKGILGGKLVNRQRINMSIIDEGPSLNTHHTQLLNLNLGHCGASLKLELTIPKFRMLCGASLKLELRVLKATIVVSIKRLGTLLEMTLWRLFNNFLTQGSSLKLGMSLQLP